MGDASTKGRDDQLPLHAVPELPTTPTSPARPKGGKPSTRKGGVKRVAGATGALGWPEHPLTGHLDPQNHSLENGRPVLVSVAIKNIKPNPFRRLDEYPILRERVNVLKESIASTGFWTTIVGRPKGQDLVEIAFGHHWLVALQEGDTGTDRVEVIICNLSNEQMIKMMALENMEEWGTSAWVELETIRAVIEAYAHGEIDLPKVPVDTRKDQIRNECDGPRTRSYTMECGRVLGLD